MKYYKGFLKFIVQEKITVIHFTVGIMWRMTVLTACELYTPR